MKRADLTGRRFGRLVATSYIETVLGNAVWLFRCDCGSEKVLAARRVKDGGTKSCGCSRRDARFPVIVRHGEAGRGRQTKLNKVWHGMKQRCLNPSNPGYRWYGGRGVKIDPIWREDYAAFRDWAHANGYAEGLVVDRVDPDGDYAPDNCRWLTAEENNSRARKWGTVTVPLPRRHRAAYTRDASGRFL